MDDLIILRGTPEPLGLSFHKDIANFALFSSHVNQVFLTLFFKDSLYKKIPLQRTGDIWHIAIEKMPLEMSYVFQCEGPQELLYDPTALLIDPYVKIVKENKGVVTPIPPFDWQGDTPPSIPLSDLILYEMHVRGFTKDASSKVAYPGTYLGLIEKIPYLKELGVNAIELMPIFEFDRHRCFNINPETKEPHINYWGYSPYHFFVPNSWYAVSNPIYEFKTLVRELHKNGIEVILDVVYNHTGEGRDKSFYVNFRGIDNYVYYFMDSQGNYLDFSGCHNTINANYPAVQRLILDSLRYWIEEMHVDGFRFDLASVFTRGMDTNPMPYSPLIEAIAKDPIISKCKLISESWDAAGLYQIGEFPKWGPWSEWNGPYRDIVRNFIKGTPGHAGLFANVLTGSAMLYENPLSSINFITAHDGFSLKDLVSYEKKHNLSNGENNQDGNNQNDSWNCGFEGPTTDPAINALRERQMRNFLLALFISQGIPMLSQGDVYGHTCHGNNNPYVQDNQISWFLWDELEKNQKIFQFISLLIGFRKTHPQLREKQFLKQEDVDWHSETPFKPNWDPTVRLICFTLKKKQPLYIAFNAHHEAKTILLPTGNWQQIINTEEDWQFHTKGLPLSSSITLAPYSALLAIDNGNECITT